VHPIGCQNDRVQYGGRTNPILSSREGCTVGRGILNLIIGGVMVVGGLSGNLVLKGTQSGEALAILGGVVCLFGLYRIFSGSSEG
jgi:hypothetical protein